MFDPAEIDAIYRVIAARRDMRHFRSSPLDPLLLQRLLAAAHAGPSVGFMQPWRFIRVVDPERRQALHALVEAERCRTAQALGEREDEFMRIKVEGIRDCGEVLIAALMEDRERHVFGRRTLPEMDIASLACAIQNMWLAARAEGIGMGWVSMFDSAAVRKLFGMPEGSQPQAILCIGHVEKFYDKPMLEEQGWARREALQPLVFENVWGEPADKLFGTIETQP